MNTQDVLNFSHRIYKNSPILFHSYIGKKVKITMQDENIYCGIVYTVDPVSESIVLLQSKTSKQHRLKIIFSHAIQNVEVTLEAEMFLPELFLSSPAKLSQVMVTKRKDTIMQLLLDNRFPVKEEKDILWIEDTVLIEPPYYPENWPCLVTVAIGLMTSETRTARNDT
ncbi:PREDICTED: gem-associated protein 6-like isoform X2 [Wasmannia auropunctata]|uniref:gem-associated protein 6-like isoform X2 n=1 Tax=Wasmannia auropunctata TaxID=64793 RepID=UPI0005EDAD59|nr:PREDICTED: gem-associated protein 6-like isoform X2 [Wasmannia auropunctata]